MFIGEYQHSLDIKGRMAIPVKFRAELNSGAIITRGLDHCLFLFDTGSWGELVKKLVNLPLAQANSRAFSRLMLAGAMEVNLDSQGRILVPDYLRKYATFGKDVIVAGLYSRLEIWDQNKWREYKSATESASQAIAEKLGELGI